MIISDKSDVQLKAGDSSPRQRELPRLGVHSLQKLFLRSRFTKMTILRSTTSWTHERFWTDDDDAGGGSTWSSGKDMGTSTIVGNPPRISTNVPRCSLDIMRGTWNVGRQITLALGM